MRYRRPLNLSRVLYWFVWPAIVSAGLLRRGHPVWQAVVGGVVLFLAELPGYLFWYWQVLPDRLVQQRYWRRVEMLFSDVVRVGPLTGVLGTKQHLSNWIEVRNGAGQRIIVDAADREGFLAEMQGHLPGSVFVPDQREEHAKQ